MHPGQADVHKMYILAAGIHQAFAMALKDALRLPALIERGNKLE